MEPRVAWLTVLETAELQPRGWDRRVAETT
jgi:hypothetical protein